jgi:hypothetical protein
MVVAPPGEPAAAPVKPAEPFVVTGFQPKERWVAGAAIRAGGSSLGVDGAFDATLRWQGVILGTAVGGAAGSGDTLRTLGLLGGYGMNRGHYRGEALLGWGVASDHIDQGGTTTVYNGHYRSLQVAVDRAVWGGEAWRGFVGLGLWYRDVFGLSGGRADHSEVAGGVRIGVESGW